MGVKKTPRSPTSVPRPLETSRPNQSCYATLPRETLIPRSPTSTPPPLPHNPPPLKPPLPPPNWQKDPSMPRMLANVSNQIISQAYNVLPIESNPNVMSTLQTLPLQPLVQENIARRE